MPKVSVIMAAHNYEEFIGYAIESVLKQTFTDFELIIIDDASTDNTVKVIKRFNDQRIKLFLIKENRGESFAENYGILHSKGEHIAILNADDAYLPKKLEKQVEFLDKNPSIDAVFTKVEVIDDNGKEFTDKNDFHYKIFDQQNRSRYEWLRLFFYEGNCLCHPSVMVRRSVYTKVGLYDERFIQIQDLHLWVRLLISGNNIFILPEKLTKFRVGHPDKQISGNSPTKVSRYFFEYEKVLKLYFGINNILELTNVFPEIKNKFNKVKKRLTFFYLVSLLIEVKDVPHQNLALDVIYKLLNGSSYIKQFVNKQFKFSEYKNLSGSNDLYQNQYNLLNKIIVLKHDIKQIHDKNKRYISIINKLKLNNQILNKELNKIKSTKLFAIYNNFITLKQKLSKNENK